VRSEHREPGFQAELEFQEPFQAVRQTQAAVSAAERQACPELWVEPSV
jgi:hypothetical protein